MAETVVLNLRAMLHNESPDLTVYVVRADGLGAGVALGDGAGVADGTGVELGSGVGEGSGVSVGSGLEVGNVSIPVGAGLGEPSAV